MDCDLVEQMLLSLLPGQFSLSFVNLLDSALGNANLQSAADSQRADQDYTWVSAIEQQLALHRQRAWIVFWQPEHINASLGIAASSLQACVDAIGRSSLHPANHPSTPP